METSQDDVLARLAAVGFKSANGAADVETSPADDHEQDGQDGVEDSSDDAAVAERAANGTDNAANGQSTGTGAAKKKKKKNKSKKAKDSKTTTAEADSGKVKIARNKHMKFISSYHGPWLQLPPEILESLYHLNGDPKALAAASDRASRFDSSHSALCRGCSGHDTLMGGGHSHTHSMATFDDIAAEVNEKLPNPIDSSVFRGCSEIRKLIDDASDLAVRAASGLSAAALGAIATSTANANGSVAAALGIENTINGRSAAMSSTRQHRLRAMAVAKLAQAYTIDEVAASVAIMQGATAIDDVAEKVLKQDPNNTDAMLVHFFHEKIPSPPSVARTWAQNLPSVVLDTLIERFPERLNYFRSLGIWNTFKQDYVAAIRAYDQGIANAEAMRQTRRPQRRAQDRATKGNKKRGKGKANGRTANSFDDPLSPDSLEDQASLQDRRHAYSRNGESMPACDEAADLGKEAGDDVGRQLFFFRGMAKFQLASSIVEKQVLVIESIPKPPGGLTNEGGELTLESSGIKVKPEALTSPKGSIIGSCTPAKLARYQEALASDTIKDEMREMLSEAMADFKHFLSYFAIWEAPLASPGHPGRDHVEKQVVNQHLIRSNSEKSVPFRGRKLVHHRALNGRTRYTDPRISSELPPLPALLTSYHPLMIEAHFSILLILLLTGDYTTLLKEHYRCARLMEYIEGYPVFVPARSMNQSEYIELMELLSTSWMRAREASGISAPPPSMHEAEIAKQGPLVALHHLVAYFSEQHNTRLADAATRAESEALELAKAAAKDRKGRDVLSALNRKLLEEADFAAAKEQKSPKQIGNGTEGGAAPPNTVRSEVALAWLQVAILPPLQEQEDEERALAKERQAEMPPTSGPSNSYHESLADHFRPASSASSHTFAATSSSRAASPTSSQSVTSSKGKGKARAVEEPSPLVNGHHAGSSSKGKGRAL